MSARLLAGSVGREAASNRLMGRESHGLFREQAHDFVGLKALVNQVDYQRAKDPIDLTVNPVSVRTGRATVLGADFGSVAHSDSPGAKDSQVTVAACTRKAPPDFSGGASARAEGRLLAPENGDQSGLDVLRLEGQPGLGAPLPEDGVGQARQVCHARATAGVRESPPRAVLARLPAGGGDSNSLARGAELRVGGGEIVVGDARAGLGHGK